MRHPDVQEVSVGIPSPLLESGITLVDTPGVGGLVAGHAALTLAALSMADALLFVVNGSSELTASECQFLSRATERVATVLFVLTQIDKYPKWRQVLARNHELIAQHAPAFKDAPWFGVSSRSRVDAIRARQHEDLDRARELQERSGFTPLTEALVAQVAGHAEALRARNAVWTARRLIDELTSDTEQRLRSLAQDPKLMQEIEASRARLDTARGPDATWLRSLDSKFSDLTRDVDNRYQHRLIDLVATADRLTAEAGANTAVSLAHDFDAGIRAAWADLEAAARVGALRVAREVAAELGANGVDAVQADLPYPEQLGGAGQFQLAERAEPKDIKEFIGEYSSGVSITSTLLHLFFASINPLLLFVSGTVVAVQAYKFKQEKSNTASVRADLSRHLRDQLDHVRLEVPSALRSSVQVLRTEVERVISDRMRQRDAELEAAIAEATVNLAAAEADLAPRREAAEAALTQLRQLSARAEELISSPAEVTGEERAAEGTDRG